VGRSAHAVLFDLQAGGQACAWTALLTPVRAYQRMGMPCMVGGVPAGAYGGADVVVLCSLHYRVSPVADANKHTSASHHVSCFQLLQQERLLLSARHAASRTAWLAPLPFLLHHSLHSTPPLLLAAPIGTAFTRSSGAADACADVSRPYPLPKAAWYGHLLFLR
jgi:hypothetical protein